MKFYADKSTLAEAVISASKACAVKTAFSALDGVLLNLKGNNLTVTGYDLETGIRVNINVEGETDGEIIVESRLFSDMIRKMPDNSKILVEVKESEKVSVSLGKIKLNIQGTKGENFPNIIELNKNVSFTMKEKTLKNMLSQIDHAIARKDINPALMGARFDIENNMLYIVASDAVRLALRKEPLEFNDMGFIVSEKTVVELTRNLSDEDGDVDIVVDRNQICFSKEKYAIFSRLLDGKFVEYKKLVESQSNRELIVNTREFIDSLERSLLFINERFKSPVMCEINDEDRCIYLSCKTGVGEFDEEIGIIRGNIRENMNSEEKKSFCIAFNPRFMIDALRNSNCDEVKLEFLTELAPIKIVPSAEGDNDVLFVVVPVRLK
ncbi:MAG: DNA polymerase III subunit beta [Oscillospiraceae bacterium]|jgi:DNA polymerase-3 subunit beta|nr:DNA polymerase III subunit beta [Oscillospiraceae bacterium]